MIKHHCALFAVLLANVLAVFSADYKSQKVLYRDGSDKCTIDISYKDAASCAPVIVWFHGGGLTKGHASTPEEFLKEDYVVASVEYRLFPDVSVSEIIDDAARAVAWVCGNIESFGGDINRIYLAGHSAGGYLVCMIGLDKHYLARYGVDADKFAAIVPYSGQMITHFTERRSRGIENITPVIDSMAPLYHMREDSAPFLLMTGGRDLEMLRRYEENAYFYEMMKYIGHKDIVLYEIDGFNHGGMVKPGHLIFMKYIKSHK